MWFKNLTVFRFVEPWTLSGEELAEKLGRDVFRPCGSQEMLSCGWVAPLGRRAVDLVHAAGGCLLICLQVEEKLLPAAVINEVVAQKAFEIEEQQSRAVHPKEKQALRDEVLQDLLPRAFSRARRTFAYIDQRGGWLVVNSASRKAVEELSGRLRKALGSLPIAPPRVAGAPAAVMTAWLTDADLPGGFVLEDQCELRDGGEEGGVIRCTGQDLSGEEILLHLQAGKRVTRLSLAWDERLAFLLGENLTVRRLRFLDLVQEQLGDVDADSAEALFDAQFTLMTGELGVFLPRLLEVMGGERS